MNDCLPPDAADARDRGRDRHTAGRGRRTTRAPGTVMAVETKSETKSETKTQMPGSRAQTPSAAGASARGVGARAETSRRKEGRTATTVAAVEGDPSGPSRCTVESPRDTHGGR